MTTITSQQKQFLTRKSFLQVGSAGFSTCCIADFQIGEARRTTGAAGMESCETADLEVCATTGRRE